MPIINKQRSQNHVQHFLKNLSLFFVLFSINFHYIFISLVLPFIELFLCSFRQRQESLSTISRQNIHYLVEWTEKQKRPAVARATQQWSNSAGSGSKPWLSVSALIARTDSSLEGKRGNESDCRTLSRAPSQAK